MSRAEEDAEREASRWIARLEADDVSLRDHQRFRTWLEKKPENRLAYQSVAKTWDNLEALRFLDMPAVEGADPGRRLLVLGGAAAAAAIVVGAGAIALSTSTANATPYVTGIGERRNVTLADGSSALLNADTAMRVALSSRERRVRLVQGEALFSVHDGGAPNFIVETPFGEIQAQSATFLVRLATASARATVLAGSVEARTKTFLAAPTLITADTNQEITLDRASAARTAMAPTTLSHRLAWQNGMLAFDGDKLVDAALEIEHQTGLHFEFSDPALRDMMIGGYIRATDVNAFQELVRSDLGLRTERRGDAILISK